MWYCLLSTCSESLDTLSIECHRALNEWDVSIVLQKSVDQTLKSAICYYKPLSGFSANFTVVVVIFEDDIKQKRLQVILDFEDFLFYTFLCSFVVKDFSLKFSSSFLCFLMVQIWIHWTNFQRHIFLSGNQAVFIN